MTEAEYQAKFGKKPTKYNAKRCEIEGIPFDSLAEGDFYRFLKADSNVLHVDCHVAITLPAGVRYRVDFIAWYKTMCLDHLVKDGCSPMARAIEVKGVVSEAFRIKRRQFDQFHPLRPLQVVKRVHGRWVEV